ncbi:MAG: hypothetical protein WBQ18_15705, partial [Solirubrobacteraceae bacterium]
YRRSDRRRPANADARPALLLDASWYGTLAAARDLGRHGVPVIVGYDQRAAPTRFSRYATATVPCPPTADAEGLLAWLRGFGRRTPGCALYATSDDVAFLIAAHRESLSEHFHLYCPSLPSLLGVLDKGRLSALAEQAGLDAPRVWAPAGEPELTAMAGEIPMPVLIKPRAQMLARVWTKGIRVTRREDLLPAWRQARAAVDFHPHVLAVAPEVDAPLIQALHDASERIYTVDGFAGADGEILGALACVKTLQLPRRSGPGICFEAAELDPVIREGLERICRATGFHGVFDAEFMLEGSRRLLIDFNPRFYNHMAFEIDRGLPLAWYAYLAATGQEERLRAVAAAARPQSPAESGVYSHRLLMRVMLAAQLRGRGMSRAERSRWRAWLHEHRHAITDPAAASGDIGPAIADLAHVFDKHVLRLLRQRSRS